MCLILLVERTPVWWRKSQAKTGSCGQSADIKIVGKFAAKRRKFQTLKLVNTIYKELQLYQNPYNFLQENEI
jgi:hypothetical protein